MTSTKRIFPLAHAQTRPGAIGALIGALLCTVSAVHFSMTGFALTAGRSADEPTAATAVAFLVAGASLTLVSAVVLEKKTKEIRRARSDRSDAPTL
ncbi:hypothetical protein [Microbacterium xanthum]|uniref:hypothetical protein n=1 Tax=Microbacterium xanthum TaxID=3079794 RepID=UPI002AD271D2|nr:hypothetical protein [Microbacterium sp. KSW-48]MDZ8170774.1 hypothetical protein [Microbacterium sp. KSW-48]